jgi:hypothetical protein
LKLTKSNLLRAGKFLRLVDRDGNFSLTNIVLIAVTVHLLRQPGLEVQDLLAFVAGVIGYQVRQTLAAKLIRMKTSSCSELVWATSKPNLTT